MNDPEKKIARGVFLGLAAFFIGVPPKHPFALLVLPFLLIAVGAVGEALDSWYAWLFVAPSPLPGTSIKKSSMVKKSPAQPT